MICRYVEHMNFIKDGMVMVQYLRTSKHEQYRHIHSGREGPGRDYFFILAAQHHTAFLSDVAEHIIFAQLVCVCSLNLYKILLKKYLQTEFEPKWSIVPKCIGCDFYGRNS